MQFYLTRVHNDLFLSILFLGTALDWENFLTATPNLSELNDRTDVPPRISFPSDLPFEDDQDLDSNIEEKSSQGGSVLQLFQDSDLSLNDSLICVLTFAQSAHLSGQDLCKLLDLLHVLMPKPNNLPESKHSFFKHFKNDTNEMKIYWYCNICWLWRKNAHDSCTKCKDSKVKYFIQCPLVPQLQKKFSRCGFEEKIRHKHTRTKINPNNIEDIYDGSLYKEAEKTILSDSRNISLTWYTDGVSIYECSSYSLWPFVYVINELSPEERFKPENLILGGLWGDAEKPHPNVFLLPLYSDIASLKDGFSVKFHNSNVESQVKAVLLCGTCDMPAKAAFMNLKGHAGYYSCSKCLIKGEKSDNTGQVMVFPHQEELELRNDTNYKECVKESIRTKYEYKGVLGPSVLSFMFYLNFFASVSVDSMHCVFLGITKQLLKLWFSTKYSTSPFSLVQHTDKVNKRLKNLKLPHFVQRLPEDVTKLHFWKATLLRNFLLYFSKVVMKGVMKPDYFNNLCQLVDGISILNQSSLSLFDLNEADDCLKKFCKDFQRLYGVRHMSANIHLLRHLAMSVRETGNLWVSSCYRFEDLNGKMSDLAHGSRHATMQIFTNFSVLTELPIFVSKLNSELAKFYCLKSTSKGLNFKTTQKLCDDVYIVGDIDGVTQHLEWLQELCSPLFQTKFEITTFSRLYKDKKLYVAESCKKGSRVSSYCKYIHSNAHYHGNILTFVQTFSPDSVQYHALVQRSDYVPIELQRYVKYSVQHHCLDLIPINNLLCVSFCLNVDNCLYLIDPLNDFDMQ